MLKPGLCDYSDAFIHADKKYKGVIFKNCVLFTNCISEINNTKLDHGKDLGVAMSMHSLIEYSDNYSKTMFYVKVINIILLF